VGQAAATALSAVLAQAEGADWHDLEDLERRGLIRPIAEASLLIATNVRNALLPLGLAFVEFVAAEAPAPRESRNARRRRADAPASTAARLSEARAQTVVSDPRLAILRELRSLNRQQARTSAILELDLEALAGRLGMSIEVVRDALIDLLAERSVEPNAAAQDHPAESGRCRITQAGMQELARLEVG